MQSFKPVSFYWGQSFTASSRLFSAGNLFQMELLTERENGNGSQSKQAQKARIPNTQWKSSTVGKLQSSMEETGAMRLDMLLREGQRNTG